MKESLSTQVNQLVTAKSGAYQCRQYKSPKKRVGNASGYWKGDRIIYRGQRGRIVSQPEYVNTETFGLWFADVLWSGGTETRMCLNSKGFRKEEK